MRLHDKVAIAGALAHALKELDAEIRAEYVEWADENGIKSTEPSIGGTLTVARRKGKIVPLADEFEDWVREHQPHNIETIERVRPAATEAILRTLRVRDGVVVREIVDDSTGEVTTEPFPYAVDTPDGNPYASWRGGDEPKAEAVEWIRGRFETIAELMQSDRKQVESGE